MERWKSIPGYEGWYEASDQGRVRSLDRYITTGKKRDRKRLVNGKVLKPRLNKGDGGMYVYICKDDIRKNRQVHRLILEAFVGLCPEGMECAHNNGNHTDNRLENLRWTTHKDNNDDKYKHGTIPYGEKHSMCKLSDNDVKAIKTLLRNTNLTQRDIANLFDVEQTVISGIKLNKSRTNVLPDGWEKNHEYKTRTQLTEDNIRLIKILLRRGNLNNIQIGKLFNLDPSSVSRIKTGKNYPHILP